MFTHKHYVPVLRWKRAERVALRELRKKEKSALTPLVEFIPRDFTKEPFKAVLLRKVSEIGENWGLEPIFVDFIHLDTDDTESIDTFFGRAASRGLQAIPVTGLRRGKEYQDAVASAAKIDQRGACLRVRPKDVSKSEFANDIAEWLEALELTPEQTDLVVDYATLDDSSPSIRGWCVEIPFLRRWRTFTVASGAFPKDLSQLEKNRQHLIRRADWIAWEDSLNDGLQRLPAFGDYTIQHGIYEEPPGRANFSASIRYTAEEDWVIMRGEGVFNEDGPGFDQWPANAQLLCGRSEFCGEDFSYGDRYILEMSLQEKKTGSAETWLRAGVNHHLVYVVQQIANLGDV